MPRKTQKRAVAKSPNRPRSGRPGSPAGNSSNPMPGSASTRSPTLSASGVTATRSLCLRAPFRSAPRRRPCHAARLLVEDCPVIPPNLLPAPRWTSLRSSALRFCQVSFGRPSMVEIPAMTEILLPTTVVGSYPQPDWLIDREKLTHLPPIRVRAQELWRVPELWLEQAQDDATVLAIRDMERAGIDIITDGEIRRESYSNRFATALSGIDLDNPATVPGRTGGSVTVPRVVGPIRRLRPVEVR